MNSARAICSIGLMLVIAAVHAEKLTFERLRADPPVSGPVVLGLKVAPDGKRVTYLKGRDDNQDVLELWQFEAKTGTHRLLLRAEDLAPGETKITAEEQARRQRARIRQTGITRYDYDETGRHLIVPLGGDLYVYDLATRDVVAITGGGARIDPKLSPSGDRVAFVRERDLWTRELADGRETRLTASESDTVVNGLAEFIAQEEMGRFDGFWWSPDGTRIAFIQYDEAPVNILERVAIGGDGATLTKQRYPLAGTPNVRVRIGIAELASHETRWIDLGTDSDIYIPLLRWNLDGSRLFVERETRSQRQLDLLGVDPRSARVTRLIRETSSTWINLSDDLKPLTDGRFLWSSERSGFRHVYLYDADGANVVALTAGDWVVDEIACVDEKGRQVYFTGWRDDPLERHLYRAGFDAKKPDRPERVSDGAGTHRIAAAKDCSLYADTFASPNQPPQASLHDKTGKRLTWLLENRIDAQHPYAPYLDSHVIPEFGTLEAEDGSALHYSLFRPPDFDPSKRYAAVVFVYGGPGVQNVRRTWGPLDAQIYAAAGFVVFTLDNRGSAGRGHAFESPIHRQLGDIETRDQLAGVRYLKTLPFIDATRIGVKGWSYGGYMTLMLLAKGGKDIAAGFAGAPVTDWRLYDTHYTERYLDTPELNDVGYTASSVFPYLEGIDGALLLMHSMADDNVFFTNSTKLMQALQRAGKPFELMTYPGETHFITNRSARLHADLTGLRFFEHHLKGSEER